MTNPTPHGQVPNKYLTVVYRDIAPGKEARELIEHPKMSASSWSHALNDRDAAIAQVSTLRTAHVQNPAEIEHVAGDVSKNGAEVNMGTQQPAPAGADVRRSDLVPGVMHCAKCKFQLNRVTLCVSDGNAYAGDNKTEPCPNGCGPLWPVTWEQEARNCWKTLEEMHERLQAAESVPAIQGETNVQLDTDSNHSAPGQQRDMACSLALGQPVGNGQDQAAGRPSAQGDKLLTVAERNIRSFLRSATFKSESDREAALNCVDVLWAAARDPADSVPAQVLVAALIAAKQAINSMKADAETAAQGDEQVMLEACETISNEGLQADIAIRAALASAQQPAPSAAVLDYPHARRFGGCPACGRSDCVAMSCTRTTSDDLLHIAARKQGGA